MASRPKEKENHRHEQRSTSDHKHVVTAIINESGEVAPVDFSQFGKRTGEIIARATRLPRRKPH